MNTFIALLRGINVSGQKKIKMADLKEMLDKLGFKNVQTYIQSGNVIFSSEVKEILKLEEEIKNGIEKTFGFDVSVLIKTKREIEKILDECPFKAHEDLEAKRIYYVLLKSEPQTYAIENLNQKDYPNELFSIVDNCVYLNCTNGAGNAKLTNNVIERKLKVSATTRNHRTMMKLLEMTSI